MRTWAHKHPSVMAVICVALLMLMTHLFWLAYAADDWFRVVVATLACFTCARWTGQWWRRT